MLFTQKIEEDRTYKNTYRTHTKHIQDSMYAKLLLGQRACGHAAQTVLWASY